MSRRSISPRNNSETGIHKIRVDKWLWAARFFKTRSLAIEAIKGGKVSAQGIRVKPSKELQVGDCVTIRQGYAEKTVIVLALSNKRGPATQAALLYEETEESIQKREQQKSQRTIEPALHRTGSGRPTKRERRKIIKFTANQ